MSSTQARTTIGTGKSDAIDALAAAHAVLSSDVDELINPRSDGLRLALRVLLVARRAIDTRRTADRNALTALIRTYELNVDARRALTYAQVRMIAAWRQRPGDDAATATIRGEARRLAKAVLNATDELVENRRTLADMSATSCLACLTCPESDQSWPPHC